MKLLALLGLLPSICFGMGGPMPSCSPQPTYTVTIPGPVIISSPVPGPTVTVTPSPIVMVSPSPYPVMVPSPYPVPSPVPVMVPSPYPVPGPTVTVTPKPSPYPVPSGYPVPGPTVTVTPKASPCPVCVQPSPSPSPKPSVVPSPSPKPSSLPSPAMTTLKVKGTVTGAIFGYVEYLPAGYSTGSNYPLIVHLHGVGEREGENANATLQHVGDFGPTAYAKSHPLNAVILSPQSFASPYLWTAADVDNFVEFAFGRYKVDRKRFYIMGLSMGGMGVNRYLATYSAKPAAAVAICPGSALSWAGAAGVVANKLPYWGAHAQDDTTTKIDERSTPGFSNISQNLGGPVSIERPVLATLPTGYSLKTGYFDPLQKKFVWIDGQKTVAGVPPHFFTEYSQGGHVIWTRLYNDPQLYTWAFSKTK